MKKPSKELYEMKTRKEQGERVDDIAYDYGVSNAYVYKAINRVNEYEANGHIVSINDLEIKDAYSFHEMIPMISKETHELYRIISSLYINDVSVIRDEEEKQFVKINLAGWKNSRYRNNKEKLLEELSNLKVYFLKTDMIHALAGIRPYESIKVFESIELDNSVLTATFSETFIYFLCFLKVVIRNSTTENINYN